MANFVQDAFRAGLSTGTVITVNSTASFTAIPNDSSGNPARAIYATCNTTTGVHVRLTTTSTGSTATTSDGLWISSTAPVKLLCRGASQISAISEGASGFKLFISPIEDA